MTIDPKAAELAKALADAVAAQQTPGYEELSKAAEEKAIIDKRADQAAWNLREHYAPTVGQGQYRDPSLNSSLNYQQAMNAPLNYGNAANHAGDVDDIFASEPERYELPEDETASARPNGGLSD